MSLLSGCVSVPMASLDQDAKAKIEQTLPDRASLFIYRDEILGGAIPMTISVNGKTLGRTVSKTYFYLSLKPGTYKIESYAEDVSTLSITLEPNKKYYVWEEVKMGLFIGRSLLRQVDQATGQSGVSNSQLIYSAYTGIEIEPLESNNKIKTSIDINQSTPAITLEQAKAKCLDLGFKVGTESFGQCVLKVAQ